MKYLNKLFAFDDRQSHQQSSARLTSTIYQVTFVPKSSSVRNQTGESSLAPDRPSSSSLEEEEGNEGEEKEALSHNRVTILARSEPLRGSSATRLSKQQQQQQNSIDEGGARSGETGSLGNYLLSATIGKTIASTSTITPLDQCDNKQDDDHRHLNHHHHYHQQLTEEDDWILVGGEVDSLILQQQQQLIDYHKQQQRSTRRHAHSTLNYGTTNTNTKTTTSTTKRKQVTKKQQMALDKTDVELIKTSWIPVSKDPVAHGVLLFKGLFTKFPEYLSFFPQFSDLDLDRMHENKRLLRHAVRVIETVTFVVDAIGDESKTSQLNEALINLVKGHIKRRIGLAEFRNLGIVLIDFICDVNQRKGNQLQINGGGTTTTQTMLVAAWTKLYSGILDLVEREEEKQHQLEEQQQEHQQQQVGE